uniref:Reverse transcriptase domain-containing protein n=1 Tax=Graphocephala atropunctata TaxID=36148 RepID=A0A1B6MLT2_9HEMI
MEVNSYRPISLISIISKLIEKIALKRLLAQCDENELMTPNQHGFRKHKSTATALITLFEETVDHIDAGRVAAGIMLDYSKAFDCLSHTLILTKLQSLGVVAKAADWFSNYLSDRYQVVELPCQEKGTNNKVLSMPLPITRVLQGSVLGSALFILTTNDLPAYLGDSCTPIMYADATTLVLGKENIESLQMSAFIATNLAPQYCHENDLVINTQKTKQLMFGRRGREEIALPEVDVEESAYFLGIIIDSCFTWSAHIDSVCRKLNTGIFLIQRMMQIGTPEIAKIVYHAFCETHVMYGIVAWG